MYNLNVYKVNTSMETSKGTLLFLPDAFGLASHNLILSDLYAAEGKLFITIVLFGYIYTQSDFTQAMMSC